LTYNVHAASTVLADATMRSRRNFLDEIDASTLRLISAQRISSADRWARTFTRSGQKTDFNVGLSQRTRGEPLGLPARAGQLYHPLRGRSRRRERPRQPRKWVTRIAHPFGTDQRMLPFWPMAMLPGWGQ
jgi:hypothetical protein